MPLDNQKWCTSDVISFVYKGLDFYITRARDRVTRLWKGMVRCVYGRVHACLCG